MLWITWSPRPGFKLRHHHLSGHGGGAAKFWAGESRPGDKNVFTLVMGRWIPSESRDELGGGLPLAEQVAMQQTLAAFP